MSPSSPTLIDVHTHIYPLSYLELLRSRTKVPCLLYPSKDESFHGSNSSSLDGPRLLILPSDDDPAIPASQRGRPIDGAYSSETEIIRFMDAHSIRISVLSLANPWLDFLSQEEGAKWALKVNADLNAMCESSKGRFYAFGTLPLSASATTICHTISVLDRLEYLKGVIMGTSGLGNGLDDLALDPVYAALEQSQTLIFLHPHYGLPNAVFGPRARKYGHVLPLALGFPMETSIAFVRMFLSGVFDRFPRLKVLIAHAGATVPFLAGRIHSCVEHERHFYADSGEQVAGPQRTLQQVLASNIWLDAVVYSSTAVKAAAEVVGKDRVLFGTDHPFFPPLEKGAQEWKSVNTNKQAIRDAFGDDDNAVKGVLGENAANLLDLPFE